jgi:hypothetical protein
MNVRIVLLHFPAGRGTAEGASNHCSHSRAPPGLLGRINNQSGYVDFLLTAFDSSGEYQPIKCRGIMKGFAVQDLIIVSGQ